MKFTEAICEAHKQNLTLNNKVYIFGLGVNYENGADGTTHNLAKYFPSRVLDVPVSELSFTGMAVGLASQGFRPTVHHGRIEFALLAIDQILTQCSRWNYMFGGDYLCPATFRISVGRQWGNGPQHTASYHSLFLNAPGIDVFIPSSPQEAFDAIKYSVVNKFPSVILEHRWLNLVSQSINTRKKIQKPSQATLYENSSKNIIVTYGDGLIASLQAQKYLDDVNIDTSVLSLNYFSSVKRLDEKVIKYILKYNNIFFVDTSPHYFGIIHGIMGQVSTYNISKKFFHIHPPFHPCPTSLKMVDSYYPSTKSIIKFIKKKIKSNKLVKFEQTFENLHLWPDYNFDNINYKISKI